MITLRDILNILCLLVLTLGLIELFFSMITHGKGVILP